MPISKYYDISFLSSNAISKVIESIYSISVPKGIPIGILETLTLYLDNTLLTETIMNNDQKDRYKNILKKQYQNLAYEIKNETIDGDKATVEVEIKVYDYYKINMASETYYSDNQDEFKNGDTMDIVKYNDYKLDELDKAKDKVTYTLNLTLHKEDDKWVLDDLTDVEISKLHGLYAY